MCCCWSQHAPPFWGLVQKRAGPLAHATWYYAHFLQLLDFMVHKITILQGHGVGLGGDWGGPSVGLSNSIRLVLPISVAVWEMILMYVWSTSSCSCALASSGMSASVIDLSGALVWGSSCRLVPSGISGNNFALLHHTWLQLTSWISSHLPAGASVAKGELLDILQKRLLY